MWNESTERPLPRILLGFLFFGSVSCIPKPDPVIAEWGSVVPELRSTELNGETLVDISDLLDIERSNSNLPALGGGLVIGDRVVAMGVSGTRKATGTEEVTLEDKWHIGSITKSITATLTASLIEDGILTWDTTVTDVVQESEIDPGWTDVRAIDLVRHLGGTPEPNMAAIFKGRMSEQPAEAERRDWIFRDVLLESPRNRKFHYTNGNYILLGAMLEELTQTPWQTLTRERIFEPLGLSSAGFGAPKDDQPWGHIPSDSGPTPIFPGGLLADNPPVLGPAGTVHMSLYDLGRYAMEHLALYSGNSDVWQGEAFKRLYEIPENADRAYAGGWILDDDNPAVEGLLIHHNGSNSMWLAKVGFAPDRNMGLFCASNYFDKGKADLVCQNLFTHLANFAPIQEKFLEATP